MPGYKRKLQPGSIPKIWKDVGEEKTISRNPVGNPSKPSRNQVKRIARKQQVSHLKTTEKLELDTILLIIEIKQMFWENINTEHRERKIYSHAI